MDTEEPKPEKIGIVERVNGLNPVEKVMVVAILLIIGMIIIVYARQDVDSQQLPVTNSTWVNETTNGLNSINNVNSQNKNQTYVLLALPAGYNQSNFTYQDFEKAKTLIQSEGGIFCGISFNINETLPTDCAILENVKANYTIFSVECDWDKEIDPRCQNVTSAPMNSSSSS